MAHLHVVGLDYVTLNIKNYMIKLIKKHKQSNVNVQIHILFKTEVFTVWSYYLDCYYHYGGIIKQIMTNPWVTGILFDSLDSEGSGNLASGDRQFFQIPVNASSLILSPVTLIISQYLCTIV